MGLLDSNQPQYRAMLGRQTEVIEALSKDRGAAKEIILERYRTMLDAMSSEQLAYLVVLESSQAQIRTLWSSLCEVKPAAEEIEDRRMEDRANRDYAGLRPERSWEDDENDYMDRQR